ncbi:MAG TPA: hypothetical protein VD963_10470 [Phycisphaerales bacterium]|nr:hypothetical protein [Phycisphaerales bacterium]
METGRLNLAVSPYHLTTGEAPALAALTLGDLAITLMPVPFGGTARADVREAVRRSPAYLHLMDSWRWTMPLWRAGVIASTLGGDDVAGELAGALRRVANEPGLAGLRGFMRPELFRAQDSYLAEVARDVLRGGPDPAVSVPVVAALDAFAARHGLTVLRAGPDPAAPGGWSLAQRAEAALARRTHGIAIPLLLHPDGELLMRLRRDLADPLRDLRAELARAGEEAARGAGADQDALAAAASAFATAFARWREDPEVREDEAGVRAPAAWVSLTAALLPADAVLRSSATAAQAMGPGVATPGPSGSAPESGAPAGPGVPVRVLFVRRMSIQPHAVA